MTKANYEYIRFRLERLYIYFTSGKMYGSMCHMELSVVPYGAK